MTGQAPQKDAMDVLQAWVDDFNARAGPAIRLGSAGEAGGAQLRLRYSPADGQISILHLVAVERAGRADRKSTRLNSSHSQISYAAFCLKKTENDTDAV